MFFANFGLSRNPLFNDKNPSGTRPSGFYVMTLQGSLSLLAQSGEGLLVGNSDLGEHLAVQGDSYIYEGKATQS